MKRLAEHHHILRITPLHRPPQRLKLVRSADAQGINSTSCCARSIQLYRERSSGVQSTRQKTGRRRLGTNLTAKTTVNRPSTF